MMSRLKRVALFGAVFSAGFIVGAASIMTLLHKNTFSETASAWVTASTQLVDDKGQVRSQENAAILSFSSFISLTPIIGANFTLTTPSYQEQIHAKAKAIVQNWDVLSQRETLVVTPEEAKPYLDCIAQGSLDDDGAGIQKCSLDAHQRLHSKRANASLTTAAP